MPLYPNASFFLSSSSRCCFRRLKKRLRARERYDDAEKERDIRERELFFTIVSGFNLLRLREYIYARYYVGSFFDDDAGRRMRVERNQQRANDDDERDVRERTKSV